MTLDDFEDELHVDRRGTLWRYRVVVPGAAMEYAAAERWLCANSSGRVVLDTRRNPTTMQMDLEFHTNDYDSYLKIIDFAAPFAAKNIQVSAPVQPSVSSIRQTRLAGKIVLIVNGAQKTIRFTHATPEEIEQLGAELFTRAEEFEKEKQEERTILSQDDLPGAIISLYGKYNQGYGDQHYPVHRDLISRTLDNMSSREHSALISKITYDEFLSPDAALAGKSISDIAPFADFLRDELELS